MATANPKKQKAGSEKFDLPCEPMFLGYSASRFPKSSDRFHGRIRIWGNGGRVIMRHINATNPNEIQKWSLRMSHPARRRITITVVNPSSAIEAGVLFIKKELRRANQPEITAPTAIQEHMPS